MTDEQPQIPGGVIDSAARSRRLPRPVVLGVSAVVALAVAVGGGTWAVGKVGDADRTGPPTRAWPASALGGISPPDEQPPVPDGVGAKLLPVMNDYEPDGYPPGPDIGSLGNDNVLDARATAEHAKDAARGLKEEKLERFSKALGKLKFTGGAQRSYSDADADAPPGPVPAEDRLFVVEMHLAQVEEAGAERALSQFRSDAVDILGGGLREGPSSGCVPLPGGDEPAPDASLCIGNTRDVLVMAYAYDRVSLDTKEIDRMFAEQLGRLAASGESA
ncbi:hypothetical protein ACFTTN_09150 [Streptomyces niveus]|uniref:hypothetical protein n=1 Tax=Streptomyces niveus TaxID=193462 RepID=UPI00363B6BF8